MSITHRLHCLLLITGFMMAGCASTVAPPVTDHIHVTYAADAVRDTARSAPAESDKARQSWQEALSKHLAERVASSVPSDNGVDIHITMIERAGGFEPWRGPSANDVRIVRDIYPPRIDLDFVQKDAQGKIIKQAQRQLRDQSFMMHTNRYPSDPLRYEKELLDDWVRKEFGR